MIATKTALAPSQGAIARSGRRASAPRARPLTVRPSATKGGGGGEKAKQETVTGISFQPMEEVAPVLRSTTQVGHAVWRDSRQARSPAPPGWLSKLRNDVAALPSRWAQSHRVVFLPHSLTSVRRLPRPRALAGATSPRTSRVSEAARACWCEVHVTSGLCQSASSACCDRGRYADDDFQGETGSADWQCVGCRPPWCPASALPVRFACEQHCRALWLTSCAPPSISQPL